MIVAETSRLILRYFIPDDIDALFAILSDPEVMRYSVSGVKTRSQTADFLDLVIDYYRQYNYSLYAVIFKETNQLIGFCGLLPWKLEHRSEIEIGYRLAKEYWGKGLATEAAIATRDYGWSKLNMDKLYCLIEPKNKRSIRVAEKLGMKYEKNIFFHNLDVKIYSVSRESYFKG